MSGKIEITQKQVQARAASKSFSRGQNYYRNGSVSHMIKRGNTIEARCQGSYPEPYHVQAIISDSGIVSTACNCQYDWGGDCKHIVAMLLSYINLPEQFEERPPIQDVLMSRNKEELIEIIQLMVTRYPDLQYIVDRPTSREIAGGKVTIDTLKIRQGLRDSYSRYGYHYYDDYDYISPSAYNINEVTALAKRFSDSGDWHNASLMYRTILEEFADIEADEYHDEEGELASEINNVVSAIEECLKQDIIIANDKERRAIFDALLGVYIWDVDFGGIDVGYDAPEIVLRYIQREDIVQIREKIKIEHKHSLNKEYSSWSAEAYSAFLIELDTLDEVDPEIILENLRSQGMYQLLIKKLLELKRLDEATKVFQEHIQGRYERIKTLYLFMDNGYPDRALQFAEDDLAKTYENEMANWLILQYEKNGNQEKQFHWQQVRMKHQPTLRHYQNLKQIAQALQQWDSIYPGVIRDLEKESQFDVLTRAYMEEEEWDLAWKTLSKVGLDPYPYYSRRLDLDLAHASKNDMPERAIPVFISYARKFIDNRGRDNYHSAAELLINVQRLYDDLGEYEEWETLIMELRREFKQLPALQDELNKAGL